MKQLGDVLKLATQYLEQQGIKRARRMSEELLAHILKKKRIDLYMEFDRPLEEVELAEMRQLLKRKAKEEPLEYITGETLFYHCTLEITPAVLIPRQETEILLDKVCKEISASDHEGKIAWDLCTGSGCLGIGLKNALPKLEVALSDISEAALALAKKNAECNETRVSFYQGDLLEPFKGQKADYILCNPPYVSEKEYILLDASVKNFEPKQALVGGEVGTELYGRLAKELPAYLNPRGRVYFEIGLGQGEALLDLFSDSYWRNKKIEKDWAGHERFFFLEIE